MGLNVILPLAGGLAVVVILVTVVLVKNRTAYLGPVKEELQKEKGWLRRGEYNAAMVKGRQNLELLLKLIAEKNGIQLDNSVKEPTPKAMTHHQFNRWLSENGYIDRVARWEMNQVRIIGNKAVHEGYADKDDAWNQFNYLEDVLKTITERSQNPKKRQEVAKQQAQEHTEKKKKRRNKKSGQKKQAAKEVNAAAAAEVPQQKQTKQVQTKQVQTEVPQAEQDAEKKAKRRRRRKKKPQNQQVQAEAVKATEAKPAANEGEKKPNPHKRRRRRRPRKPQGVQEQKPSGEKE